jgi:long-chain acyl-CoA synthetase
MREHFHSYADQPQRFHKPLPKTPAAMTRPWLVHYPKAMPTEITLEGFSSIAAFFERTAEQYATRPAFANMGTTLTYADIEEQSRAFANYLHHDLSLKKGERVAIMLPNILQNPIAIFGALRAGLVVVNVNPLYTARELKLQLQDSGASAIVVLENFAHLLPAMLPELALRKVIVTRLGDCLIYPRSVGVNLVVKYVKRLVPGYDIPQAVGFKDALKRGEGHAFDPPRVGLEDIAFLQYTGGTTGVSKGAGLTNKNLLANMQQVSYWIRYTTPSDKKLEPGHEVVVTALPIYHIFALTANLLTFMGVGGMNYLITNPRDMKRFVKELKTVRFTCFTGVNTLFSYLLKTPGFTDLDFSSLKITLGGGMAVNKSIARCWRNVTGCTLTEAYGLTESSPAVCINRFDLDCFNGSIGPPLPSTECSIQDSQGTILAAGEIGELCVRGPQVMKGYWNRPEETKNAFTEDGWLRTGDLARMDETGLLYIVDRKKDMIIVSGFNVYPSEIESVITAHPGVAECAVIGVPDLHTGEAVKAIVVKSDPELDGRTLRSYCRGQLTGYKNPKYIEFVDHLPKTAVGKILRRALRRLGEGKRPE